MHLTTLEPLRTLKYTESLFNKHESDSSSETAPVPSEYTSGSAYEPSSDSSKSETDGESHNSESETDGESHSYGGNLTNQPT